MSEAPSPESLELLARAAFGVCAGDDGATPWFSFKISKRTAGLLEEVVNIDGDARVEALAAVLVFLTLEKTGKKPAAIAVKTADGPATLPLFAEPKKPPSDAPKIAELVILGNGLVAAFDSASQQIYGEQTAAFVVVLREKLRRGVVSLDTRLTFGGNSMLGYPYGTVGEALEHFGAGP